ncbi:MAG: DUF4129 domain-containing protein [Gemmatimonadetes bacterium]|nr:DUF4129 domain-containing protein [Gemmatimonadota bacterium]
MTRVDMLGGVLLAVGAGLMVTLVTSGPDTLPPILDLSDRWTLAVRILGVAIAFGALRVLLARHRHASRGGRAAEAPVITVRTTAIIMGLLAVIAVSTRPPSPVSVATRTGGPVVPSGWIDFGEGSSASTASSRSRGGTSPIRGSRLEGGRAPQIVPGVAATAESAAPGLFSRIGRSLLPFLILAMLAVVAYRAFMRRIAPRTPTWTFSLEAPDGSVSVAAVEESLDPLVWDVGTAGDQISAAYRRLLHALASAGAARRPHEAPHEHLHRILGGLDVRLEPLQRLANLYVMSEFGHRPVTDGHRADARRALESSLRELETRGAT